MRTVRVALVYAALWSPVALGFALALALTDRMPWPRALVAGGMSTLPAAVLGLGVIRLCELLPWREGARAPFFLSHALAAIAFTTLWSAAIVSQMWLVAPREEVDKFLELGLAWQLVTGLITYALIAGALYARGALRREAQQTRAVERAETLRLRAELSALRARLDPHFLFNVLQTLGALAAEQPTKTHAALEHLSGLLRRRIDAGADSDDSVSFANELADARQYLALERLRVGDRLATTEDVDPATLPLVMPKFMLQPLVENAIRHGLAPRAEGGRLTIQTRVNGTHWTLSVIDDGTGADPSRFEGGSSVGIPVLRDRLRLRFGGDAGLAVNTAPGAGCSVTVRLPILTDDGE